MMDVHAEAHLRYLEESPRDGLLAMYKQRLKVVGEDGRLCDERVWCVVERAAPFTLWIPDRLPGGFSPSRIAAGQGTVRPAGCAHSGALPSEGRGDGNGVE